VFASLEEKEWALLVPSHVKRQREALQLYRSIHKEKSTREERTPAGER